MDPKSAYLKTVQELNDTCCPILDAFGYDGSQFRVLLPVRDMIFRKMQITKAHIRERQDAIAAAKPQGSRTVCENRRLHLQWR
jgi:hypothetical protein